MSPPFPYCPQCARSIATRGIFWVQQRKTSSLSSFLKPMLLPMFIRRAPRPVGSPQLSLRQHRKATLPPCPATPCLPLEFLAAGYPAICPHMNLASPPPTVPQSAVQAHANPPSQINSTTFSCFQHTPTPTTHDPITRHLVTKNSLPHTFPPTRPPPPPFVAHTPHFAPMPEPPLATLVPHPTS